MPLMFFSSYRYTSQSFSPWFVGPTFVEGERDLSRKDDSAGIHTRKDGKENGRTEGRNRTQGKRLWRVGGGRGERSVINTQKTCVETKSSRVSLVVGCYTQELFVRSFVRSAQGANFPYPQPHTTATTTTTARRRRRRRRKAINVEFRLFVAGFLGGGRGYGDNAKYSWPKTPRLSRAMIYRVGANNGRVSLMWAPLSSAVFACGTRPN